MMTAGEYLGAEKHKKAYERLMVNTVHLGCFFLRRHNVAIASAVFHVIPNLPGSFAIKPVPLERLNYFHASIFTNDSAVKV